MTGLWVLMAAVVAGLAYGTWRLVTDGRFRGTHRVHGAESSTTASPVVLESHKTPPSSVLFGTPWAGALGERATLLQFSSAFCAPCRSTRVVLADIAESRPGVAHVEVDAEHNLDLVRTLGVSRTPTTLVLDPQGRELARATGAPRRDEVLGALNAMVGMSE